MKFDSPKIDNYFLEHRKSPWEYDQEDWNFVWDHGHRDGGPYSVFIHNVRGVLTKVYHLRVHINL